MRRGVHARLLLCFFGNPAAHNAFSGCCVLCDGLAQVVEALFMMSFTSRAAQAPPHLLDDGRDVIRKGAFVRTLDERQEPATREFDAQWRAIASADPVNFEAAQRAFIVRTSYSEGARIVRQAAGFELENSNPAVRQAFFATAVQHGATGGGGLIQIPRLWEFARSPY